MSKILIDRAVVEQALESVQEFKRRWWMVPAFGNKVNKATREAITNAHSPIFELDHALRAALSQQPTEPVAWIDPKHLEWLSQSPDNMTGAGLAARKPKNSDLVPLYTAPQPAKRKPLTDENHHAFRQGVRYAGNKYEAVRGERFTGGDVSDFLQMEADELDPDDIARAIERAHGIGEQE